jgi:hypothetical protein
VSPIDGIAGHEEERRVVELRADGGVAFFLGQVKVD